ncbi:hypothetical protein JB92DRAFT_3199917 [Gautieria morchelliformis]|nr:hypothetical protein JB92DRAFT_3199917 [Gautieria morchelliformis]
MTQGQPKASGPPRQNCNVIWLTILSDCIVEGHISCDPALVLHKLDWMLTNRMDEPRTFMRDNGTYINSPSVGSQTSLINVFGNNHFHNSYLGTCGLHSSTQLVVSQAQQKLGDSDW